MTPEREPFFAATYIPKRSRYGMMGMLQLITQMERLWEENRFTLVSRGARIIEALNRSTSTSGRVELGLDSLRLAYRQLSDRFDERHGGFSRAPKFPTPHNILFLLRYWRRTGQEHALVMAERTLRAMRLGGIFDHVGLGFHRYSTDEGWLAPHFEKMLYDQALLLMAYTETYQATGERFYRRVAEEIISYTLRDLTSPEGGFYSAEDADSEGQEGKFYIWTLKEIRESLRPQEAEMTINLFNLEEGGNFRDESTKQRTGTNILHMTETYADHASRLELPLERFESMVEDLRKKLFQARESRVRPLLDDKILTSWNGLMMAALAKASKAFNEPRYAQMAKGALALIMDRLVQDGMLLHRYRDGEAAIPGFLDDHAFLIWGILELYEATFEAGLLSTAMELNDALIKHFWDDDEGGFYFTADYGEKLPVRRKEIYDGAVPSGNSVSMLNLSKLARIRGSHELEDMAESMRRSFSGAVSSSPSAHALLMMGLDFLLGPSHEVVIVGCPGREDTKAMLESLWRRFLPNKVVLLKSPELEKLAEFIKPCKMMGEKATAYVCIDRKCSLPTNNVGEMLEMLEAA